MVTAVPPSVEPMEGETLVTDGAGVEYPKIAPGLFVPL